MKTISVRRSIEFNLFLESILEERERNGEIIKLKKPELERLLLHNFVIIQLKKDMINLKITKREKQWMRA